MLLYTDGACPTHAQGNDPFFPSAHAASVNTASAAAHPSSSIAANSHILSSLNTHPSSSLAHVSIQSVMTFSTWLMYRLG